MNLPLRRLGSLASALAALALVLAACGGSTATSSPTEAPEPTPSPNPTEASTPEPTTSQAPASASTGGPVGTTGRIVDEEAGYAVTLPDGWLRLDLSEGDIEQFFETGLDAMSPEAAQLLQGQVTAMLASGMRFFAIDQAGVTPEFAPNMNILVTPTGGTSLDLLEQVIVGQLEATLPDIAGEIETERLTLPSGDSLRMSYALDVDPTGGSAMQVAIHQFLIIDGAQGIFLTVSGPASDEFAAEALGIAEGFELLD
jgi:hypothetical protein